MIACDERKHTKKIAEEASTFRLRQVLKASSPSPESFKYVREGAICPTWLIRSRQVRGFMLVIYRYHNETTFENYIHAGQCLCNFEYS